MKPPNHQREPVVPAVDLVDAIQQDAQALGTCLPATAPARLAAFIGLLARWNQVYNLTAIRQPKDMVVRHILDSLAVLPWLQEPRVLDVGSGAGLPGIPLALARPDCQFHLLDSSGKRSRFLRQAVAELPLDNVTVVHSRLADYRPAGHFDSILARAFGTLAELVTGTIHLCAPGGRLLAMKGTYPDAELSHLPATCRLVGVYPLRVPHLAAERHLVHLVPTEAPTRVDSN